MPAKTNLIMTNDIQVTAREIDFVTRFERNWQHLRDILGIMRPIKKQPGAVLKSKYAEGTLQSGLVGEGEEIPYSKFTVKENYWWDSRSGRDGSYPGFPGIGLYHGSCSWYV